MPANLTPQYLDAEKRFRLAKTGPEKVQALEEMLAVIPKHKGTEKLQADIKRRLSKLRGEVQRKGGPQRAYLFSVDRQGAGQVVLVGPPNSGKSSLLAAVTHAVPEVADYPFSTRKPLPGMMVFENIKIQLVDLPPITEELTEGWVYSIIRNADLLMLVVDLQGPDLLEQTEVLLSQLEKARVLVGDWPSRKEPDDQGCWRKRALLIGNKAEGGLARANQEAVEDLYGGKLPFLAVSTLSGEGLNHLVTRTFQLLDIVRIYTKTPGEEPSFHEPVVLEKGSTIMEVAAAIHKDFRHQLKYARIWGQGKYDGQRVEKDYLVQDGDVVELHI
jgi:ribosome-interacting GTPase 1